MPDVLLFIPCEKVLVDPASNQLSIISLLDTVQPVATREPNPEDPEQIRDARYLLPPFMITTHWWRSEQEETQEFQQWVHIVAPDDRETPLGEPLAFSLIRPGHRVVQQAIVTCRLTGIYLLRLKLRQIGTETWEIKAEFPFLVEEAPIQPQDFPTPQSEEQQTAGLFD